MPTPGRQSLVQLSMAPAEAAPVQAAPAEPAGPTPELPPYSSIQRIFANKVQAKAAAGPGAPDVHAAAAEGISGPAGQLPHLEQIQRSFGRHAVGHVQAHTGTEATAGAKAMGAEAFATGDHVAFAGSPSLHIAAHEAAHVVQQRGGVQLAGGVGAVGDTYEQHADQVADLVVQGKSAEALLDQHAGGGAASSAPVQRKIAVPVVQMVSSRGSASDVTPAAEGPIGPAGSTEGTIAKLHLYVDIEAASVGIKELRDGAVGHAWIAIEYNEPAHVPDTVIDSHKALLRTGGKYSDPMGFWPDTNNGVYYSPNPFKSWVQGWMRHPDRAHEGSEKAMQSWDLTQTEVDAVIQYAESKRGAQYSVFFFNCTTFSTEAVAAAGKNAGSAGTFRIMYPNALYKTIKERQEKGRGNTMVKDFDGSNERTSNGPDGKKG